MTTRLADVEKRIKANEIAVEKVKTEMSVELTGYVDKLKGEINEM